MEEFIAYLVKNLVEHPDQVNVSTREGEKGLIIEIRAAPSDLSRVIGRGGRTIQALRTLAMTAAARHGVRVRLDVIEEEK